MRCVASAPISTKCFLSRTSRHRHHRARSHFLLTTEGTPKVSDFGLARRQDGGAGCSALAVCGLGEDADKVNDAQRTRGRKQAPTGSGVLVRSLLGNWKADPDLAGLREPSAIEALPTDEQRECLALWQDVDTVLTRARETDRKSE